MNTRIVEAAVALSTLAFATGAALAQDPATRIAAQREAMAVFKSMDGAWRGPAWILQPNGEKREFVQTERIGPFLDGSVKVIEGRGHAPDGRVTFNAFGIVSYNLSTKSYSIHSYAMGMSGDFAFQPTPAGYAWQVPQGENATIKYTATVTADTLVEVGDRVVEGKPPLRVFEMHLKRIGDSDWPAAGAIGPK